MNAMDRVLRRRIVPFRTSSEPAASRATGEASRAGARGFTLLEVMIIVAVVGVVAALAIPEFISVIRRARIEGAAQNMTRVILQARAEATYRGSPVVVHPAKRLDGDGNERHYLAAWVDVNENGKWDGTINADGSYEADPAETYRSVDYPLYEWELPWKGPNDARSNVYFWGADDADPTSEADLTEGLTAWPADIDTSETTTKVDDGYGEWGVALIYNDDGSVTDEGSFRIAMGPWGGGDREVNFLELRIAPKASGRVELRKFIPSPVGEYKPKGHDFGTSGPTGYRYEWEWY